MDSKQQSQAASRLHAGTGTFEDAQWALNLGYKVSRTSWGKMKTVKSVDGISHLSEDNTVGVFSPSDEDESGTNWELV